LNFASKRLETGKQNESAISCYNAEVVSFHAVFSGEEFKTCGYDWVDFAAEIIISGPLL